MWFKTASSNLDLCPPRAVVLRITATSSQHMMSECLVPLLHSQTLNSYRQSDGYCCRRKQSAALERRGCKASPREPHPQCPRPRIKPPHSGPGLASVTRFNQENGTEVMWSVPNLCLRKAAWALVVTLGSHVRSPPTLLGKSCGDVT